MTGTTRTLSLLFLLAATAAPAGALGLMPVQVAPVQAAPTPAPTPKDPASDTTEDACTKDKFVWNSATSKCEKAPTPASASDLTEFLDKNSWSIGLANVWTSKRTVATAEIDNGVVRVTEGQKTYPEVILMRHHYWNDGSKCSLNGGWSNFCWGLHVAAGLNSDQGLNMLGIGLVAGFGFPGEIKSVQVNAAPGQPNALQTVSQHNLGFGLARLYKVKTLGDGIQDGQPLPTGETQVRYKNTDMKGFYLFYSYTP